MTLRKKDILPVTDVVVVAVCLVALYMSVRDRSLGSLGMGLLVCAGYLQWRLSPSWSEEWISKMMPGKWFLLGALFLGLVSLIVKRAFWP